MAAALIRNGGKGDNHGAPPGYKFAVPCAPSPLPPCRRLSGSARPAARYLRCIDQWVSFDGITWAAMVFFKLFTIDGLMLDFSDREWCVCAAVQCSAFIVRSRLWALLATGA